MQVSIPGFDPVQNADSGQCFRMVRLADDNFRIIAQGEVLYLRALGHDAFHVSCTEAQWDALWRGYLDCDRDYARIRRLVPPEDTFLTAACRHSAGLRIFRQEPWETLISFIISQRKNLRAIQGCVEMLAERFGTPLGEGLNAFPTAAQLASQSDEALRACAPGYRSPYLLGTARMVAEGRVNLDALYTASDEELMTALCSFPGVGVKVANCVALFAYHRLHHFPRDVWILRVEQEHYGGRFPEEKHPGVAGVLQQYMFCYRRSKEYMNMHSQIEGTA